MSFDIKETLLNVPLGVFNFFLLSDIFKSHIPEIFLPSSVKSRRVLKYATLACCNVNLLRQNAGVVSSEKGFGSLFLTNLMIVSVAPAMMWALVRERKVLSWLLPLWVWSTYVVGLCLLPPGHAFFHLVPWTLSFQMTAVLFWQSLCSGRSLAWNLPWLTRKSMVSEDEKIAWCCVRLSMLVDQYGLQSFSTSESLAKSMSGSRSEYEVEHSRSYLKGYERSDVEDDPQEQSLDHEPLTLQPKRQGQSETKVYTMEGSMHVTSDAQLQNLLSQPALQEQQQQRNQAQHTKWFSILMTQINTQTKVKQQIHNCYKAFQRFNLGMLFLHCGVLVLLSVCTLLRSHEAQFFGVSLVLFSVDVLITFENKLLAAVVVLCERLNQEILDFLRRGQRRDSISIERYAEG